MVWTRVWRTAFILMRKFMNVLWVSGQGEWSTHVLLTRKSSRRWRWIGAAAGGVGGSSTQGSFTTVVRRFGERGSNQHHCNLIAAWLLYQFLFRWTFISCRFEEKRQVMDNDDRERIKQALSILESRRLGTPTAVNNHERLYFDWKYYLCFSRESERFPCRTKGYHAQIRVLYTLS